MGEKATFVVSEAIPREPYITQHDRLVAALKEFGAEVLEIPLVPDAPDSVFMKDSAVLRRKRNGEGLAFLSSPKHTARQREQGHREESLQEMGFRIFDRAEFDFEGGDLALASDGLTAFLGYGFRSDKRIVPQLEKFLERTVIPVELTDRRLFHLDLMLALLSDGTALACREAMTEEAWRALNSTDAIARIETVPLEHALEFCLNVVELNGTVIMGTHAPEMVPLVEKAGLKVHVTDLGEFHERSGSAACLVAGVHG